MSDIIPQKHCPKCGQDKPAIADYFIKDRRRSDGFYPNCKVCQNKAYRAKHPLIEWTQEISKRCIKCEEEYPATLEYFYALKAHSPKFKAVCRKCERATALERYRKIPKKYHHAKPGATTKVCARCKLEKPLCCFSSDKHAGTLKVSSHCSLCQNPLRPHRITQKPLPFFKVCNKCGKEKTTDDFRWSKWKRGTGHNSICKECDREKDMLHYARYVENVASGKIKPLPTRNPLSMKMCEYTARERALAAGVPCAEEVEYVRIYKRDKDLPCYICEQPILRHHRISFDHVIPITRSGAHAEENIKLVHHQCNCRKHTRMLSEMTLFQRRGM